jgi:hypothetical protein
MTDERARLRVLDSYGILALLRIDPPIIRSGNTSPEHAQLVLMQREWFGVRRNAFGLSPVRLTPRILTLRSCN